MPFYSKHRLLTFKQRCNRLKYFTLAIFILLIFPISVAFYIVFNQFEQESITQYQQQSDTVTTKINKRLFKRRALWNAMPIERFNYYQHLYNPVNQAFTKALSPLADLEYYKEIVGLKGFFQIDQHGNFNSPVWPHKINTTNTTNGNDTSLAPVKDVAAELIKRKQIATDLFAITARSGKLQQLISTHKFNTQSIKKNTSVNNGASTKNSLKRNSAFQLILDVPEYFIYYRVININNQSKLQGYILDRELFLNTLIVDMLTIVPFDTPINVTLLTSLRNDGKRYFFYRNNRENNVKISPPAKVIAKSEQLFISRLKLNLPGANYHITYATSTLQFTTAAIYSIALMVFLLIVVILGCYLFYRVGLTQLKLAEQRLNFVSAISHELKTPLTSICMYAEMLKTGIVTSSKHQEEYYEFIHSEGERLSRLISNILQLSQLSQPQQSVDPQYIKLSILMDIIRSKVSSLMDKNDFQLSMPMVFDEPDNILILLDIDAISQVVINITDNAIKFFDDENIKDKNRRKVDFTFSLNAPSKNTIQLQIRDYGTGITPEQEGKVFELFYRGGSENTRSTQGTGIGLALVNELIVAQQGTIQVQRMKPGLAMNMSFKCKFSS